MKLRLLALILFFPLVALARHDDPFSQEDLSIFQHVNVITGNLNISSQDGPFQGAYPMTIPRTYTSAGALERGYYNTHHLLIKVLKGGWYFQGGWTLLPEMAMIIDHHYDKKHIEIHLSEPSGQFLSYKYSHKCPQNNKNFFYKPKEKVKQTSGIICKRTDPSYNRIKLSLDKRRATVYLPNGGKRVYVAKDHKIGSTEAYFLEEERKPSGHLIRYTYHSDSTKLCRIEACSPSGKDVYTTLNITCSSDFKKPLKLICQSSDGKRIEYHTMTHEKREYLKKIVGNGIPHEIFHYEPSRKGIGARVSSYEIGGKQVFRAVYYAPENEKEEEKFFENPKKTPFHLDKVKKIFSPVGPDGSDVLLAHFTYHHHYTDVRDGEGLLIRYHHDENKITLVEYFNENHLLRSYQKLYWKGEELVCKALFDGNHHPLFAKTFRYHNHNVVEEVLWGSLTGHASLPLQIDHEGQPQGGESYKKHYTYSDDGFNLLIEEQEEEGISRVYCYQSGTDLISAKFAKDKRGKILLREFFFYDHENLLVREISDDGSSSHPEDFTDISRRVVKEYQHDPPTKLPSVITESYWDPSTQETCLLKTVKLSYKNSKAVAEEVYDCHGDLRYTLYTDYHDFGLITRKTTPLGRENTYHYDSCGLLIESKEVGTPRKVFSYDAANRLISCAEPEHHKFVKTTYDAKGRITSQTDPAGNLTLHQYDGFGNRIRTQLPQSKDEKGNAYFPILTFKYDGVGNLIESELPLKEKTYTSYNAFRKPLLTIHPDHSQTQNFYTKNGSLQKTIHPDGTEVHYTYDLFQQMTSKKTISKEGTLLLSEVWEYKGTQLTAHTNEEGLRVQFFYDGAGRKTLERAEDRQISFSYDSLGFLERTNNGAWTTVQKYNVEGLIEETWEEDQNGTIENNMRFHYNNENQKERVERTTSQGKAIDFLTYTDGKLTDHQDPLGNQTRITYNPFFKNDLGQNVLQKTTLDPLDHQTIETFDAQNRLSQREKRDPSNQTVFKENFSYDRSGNLAKHLSFVYRDNLFEKEIEIERTFDSMGRLI